MRDGQRTPDAETRLASVVIPCYGQSRFLAEAISSALEQDYPNKEIIVVDDGSPDDTLQVASSFGDRIVYIRQCNSGAAKARNVGIQASRGEYVAFLDADDICLAGRLSMQARILDQDPRVGLVASDAHLIDPTGARCGLKSRVSGAPRRASDFRWETVSYCATTSSVMVRRECFESAGYFEESVGAHSAGGEDWLQWVRIAQGYPMVYLPLPMIGYRLHEANVTRLKEGLDHQNRLAARLAVGWDRFGAYPAHFRAKLLFYRFATGWRVEPKSEALRYFLQAVKADPRQLPYGFRVVARGLANSAGRWRSRH